MKKLSCYLLLLVVEGYYFFEPEQTFPGQPDYPFLINIDGQREVNLTLLEYGTQVIEFKPVYRAKSGDTGRSFLNGVNGGQIFLNKNPI